MTITRRGFLKLAAAAGAVALVPVQAVEAIALVPEPVKPADVCARRLWRVRETRWTISTHQSWMELDLELVAGSCRIEVSMHADAQSMGSFNVDDDIELDVRMVGDKPAIFIDDKPAEGVYRFNVGVEYPTHQFASWNDPFVRTVVGPADTEPLKQLTACKEWGKS